jgi:hypothetical protein
MNLSLVASIVGVYLSCLVFIWMSCYPGGFWSAIFIPFFRILTIILVPVLIIGLRQIYRQREFKRSKIFSFLTILVTVIAIWTSFPQSTFFQLTAPAFETDFAKLSKNCKENRLGLYLIEYCFAGEHGDLYFKTGGLTTHGFAYHGDHDLIISSSSVMQPLEYSPLIGDWEIFEDNQ